MKRKTIIELIILFVLVIIILGIGISPSPFNKKTTTYNYIEQDIPTASRDNPIIIPDNIQFSKSKTTRFQINFYNTYSSKFDGTPKIKCNFENNNLKIHLLEQEISPGQESEFELSIPYQQFTNLSKDDTENCKILFTNIDNKTTTKEFITKIIK